MLGCRWNRKVEGLRRSEIPQLRFSTVANHSARWVVSGIGRSVAVTPSKKVEIVEGGDDFLTWGWISPAISSSTVVDLDGELFQNTSSTRKYRKNIRVYQGVNITVKDFVEHYSTNGINGISSLEYFKL